MKPYDIVLLVAVASLGFCVGARLSRRRKQSARPWIWVEVTEFINPLLSPGGATPFIKGSLGGETSVLRTFRMSGKELVKERVSERKS